MRYVYREGEPECALILQGCSVPIYKMTRVNGVLTDPNATVEVGHVVESVDLTPYKSMPIEDVGFGTREFNNLRRAEIHTMYDLLQMSANDLMTFPRFGSVSVRNIVEHLASMDLKLSDVDTISQVHPVPRPRVRKTLSRVLG